jgi:hypothetical protein
MEVTQDRPSNRNRSAFYADDQRISNSVKSHQPLIQNNTRRVTQSDEIRDGPDHKDCRNRRDCAKPDPMFTQDRSLDAPIKRIGAEPGTYDGANGSATHSNQ